MKSTATVVKRDHTGREVWRYKGEILKSNKKGIIIKARFNHSDLSFHGVCFREGDHFIEVYPAAKWFNVYEVRDRDNNTLKAWYCNVTRPASIEDGVIIYDDLALDLLVYPNGGYLVLDRDEFEDLGLLEAEKKKAIDAIQELKTIFSDLSSFDIYLLLG
jgi:predicted RNA-binding protein associated with RNAse of E/G family